MIKWIEGITIYTENARNLATFYNEKVGLKIVNETKDVDNKETFELKVGEGYLPLLIADSSEVIGKNTSPNRRMFTFEVTDIEEETQRLMKAGVRKVRGIFEIPDYGKLAVFADIDNNYFQIIQPET